MKQILIITGSELAVSFLFIFMVSSFRIDYDFMTGFGLANLVLATLTALISIAFFATGKKVIGRNIIAAAGIILLIGAGVCTIFPIKLRMM